MTCWICGDPASTGEHIVKRSDLRMLFGHVDQRNPIYLHTEDAYNKLVKGLNVELLKAPSLLCAPCNNARTARFDQAWQTLSAHLHASVVAGSPATRVDLKKIYPPGSRPLGISYREMGGRALLYLLKVFGTRLAGEKPQHPLLPSFAAALRDGTPHPHVYLTIKLDGDAIMTPVAASTDVHEWQDGNDVAMVTWGYSIARWFYQLTYARERGIMKYATWHPSDQGRLIDIYRY